MVEQQISFATFQKEFANLKTPNCLPPALAELCGGWTQETFKQVLQKLTKKNASPLPLWFDNPNNMEIISNKKSSLQDTFQMFDVKKLGRIDATELFSVILFMSKGDYPVKLLNIVEIFGMEKISSISCDEAFFFFDSFFKGLFKILIKKGDNDPKPTSKRLAYDDLKKIINSIFIKDIKFLLRDEFVDNLQKNLNFSSFLEKIHNSLQNSLVYARDEALNNMKISIEVRKCIIDMVAKIEKASKEEQQLAAKK